MSWDVHLEIDTGGAEPATVQDLGNMTWNVGIMYAEALGHCFRELDGVLCSDALGRLLNGVTDMAARKEFYDQMNPPNGWGNREGAVKFLDELVQACLDHPKATIRVSGEEQGPECPEGQAAEYDLRYSAPIGHLGGL